MTEHLRDSKHVSTGLGLSGGGSRAAAFHRGTLAALYELKLVETIASISSVSGGSVFAAGWMAAKVLGREDLFLDELRATLLEGFVRRALTPSNILRLALPGFTRTSVMGDVFDDTVCQRVRLRNLPERPKLCLNTTVLNHGQNGRFSKDGFSTYGLGAPQSNPQSPQARIKYPWLPMGEMPLGWAAAASAAFPVGLPPLTLPFRDWFPDVPRSEGLEKYDTLALSDGGLLENLGAQTLLRSRRFGTWDLIVSDAGTVETPWGPGSRAESAKAAGIALLTGESLARVMMIMNNKENRWMRHSLIEEVESSWCRSELSQPVVQPGPALQRYATSPPKSPRRRRLIMARIATKSFDEFLERIPEWRMVELTGLTAIPHDAASRRTLLASSGVDLRPAYAAFVPVKGAIAALNNVATSFTGIEADTLDLLANHARWQVLAGHAVYW